MDLSLITHYDKSYIGIFKNIGITESVKVVEVQRSDLVGENIGGTASKTAKIIKKAEGNLNPNIKNYILTFAGYKEQMNDFLKMNLGLTRRVKTVLNLPILPQRNFVTSQNVKLYNSRSECHLA